MPFEEVAKMTRMRHDNLAAAVHPAISACICQSAADARCRARAGEKGMAFYMAG